MTQVPLLTWQTDMGSVKELYLAKLRIVWTGVLVLMSVTDLS